MCLAPYLPDGMVVAFVVNRVTFYLFLEKRVANKQINTQSINRLNEIALTAASLSPSPASVLLRIGYNCKIRAAVGGESSPLWGLLCFVGVRMAGKVRFVGKVRTKIPLSFESH